MLAVSALRPEPGSNPVRSLPHLLHVLINPDSIRIQPNHIRMWVEVSSTRIQRWAWYLSHDYCRRHANVNVDVRHMFTVPWLTGACKRQDVYWEFGELPMYKANSMASPFLYSHVFCVWRCAMFMNVVAPVRTGFNWFQSTSTRISRDPRQPGS